MDDNALFLYGRHNLLRMHGFEVVGMASNGHEVQQQAHALQPYVILMDVQMPECDGLEATVERVRRTLGEDGVDAARYRRKPATARLRKLDGAQEARLVALACSPPPDGRESWTLQVLADKLVALDVVESIAPETVRQTLKKTTSRPGSTRNGVSRRKKMPPP